jgi:hypothetical protein
MSVLIGTSEPAVESTLRAVIHHTLREDYDLWFTIKSYAPDIREAMRIHAYGLVVLFVNTVYFGEDRGIDFDGALELIRAAKRRERKIVLVITTYCPWGFGSAAEQAGADAILDAPFAVPDIVRSIRAPLEARNE